MRRLLPLLVALVACDVSFPDEELIEDLRIIEVRVTPPEIPIFDRFDPDPDLGQLLQRLDTERDVELRALVAHPDVDATFEVEWIRCRFGNGTGFGRVPCSGEFKDRLPNEQALPVMATSAAVTPVTKFQPVALLAADFAETSTESLSEADIGTGLAGFAGNPRDVFSGIRAFVNMQARVASQRIDVDTLSIEGVKRLVLFDPTIVAIVARTSRTLSEDDLPRISGIELPTLCRRVRDDEFAEVLDYLERRTPNQAPTYETLEVTAPGETATTSWSPGDPPIELRPGESVSLRGRLADGDLETYQLIDDNCHLVDFDETASWSWFTNAGSFTNHITSERLDRTDDVDTRYQAPASTDLERDVTRVRVWSVLRDGRGGSDSRHLDLVILRGG